MPTSAINFIALKSSEGWELLHWWVPGLSGKLLHAIISLDTCC